jgi:hypothetical protein
MPGAPMLLQAALVFLFRSALILPAFPPRTEFLPVRS